MAIGVTGGPYRWSRANVYGVNVRLAGVCVGVGGVGLVFLGSCCDPDRYAADVGSVGEPS